MALTVERCMQLMEQLAPATLAAEWDNVGLQLGSARGLVRRVLVCLTVTEEMAARAVREQADLIVAHHPLIFRPIKSVCLDTPLGDRIATLLQGGVALYVSHTNLDHAPQGLNHWLAELFTLSESEVLNPLPGNQEAGLGRVGYRSPISLAALTNQVTTLLGHRYPRVIGDPDRKISKIAVCGGSGGRQVERAARVGADVLITGDVDYHDALIAREFNLAVIDAGHFATERVMVRSVAAFLRDHLPECLVSEATDGDDPFDQVCVQT